MKHVDYENEVITDQQFKSLRFRFFEAEFGTRWYTRNERVEILYNPLTGNTQIWEIDPASGLLWEGTVENFAEMKKKVEEFC